MHLNRNDLKTHHLAGGNVTRVVWALVSAQKANIPLDFKIATGINLARRDVYETVSMSLIPKVINTPLVTTVVIDRIQLIAKTRVTVRTNIRQLVGRASEETILTRVGEGIVSSIGSSLSHKQVLENPDFISEVVLSKGLNAGTAFEILSIDIDVGRNIGNVLQLEQTKAEERRTMAVATEQEMRTKVIETEAQIPLTMAQALREGNLDVMNYFQLKNIQADTHIRDQLAEGTPEPPKPHA